MSEVAAKLAKNLKPNVVDEKAVVKELAQLSSGVLRSQVQPAFKTLTNTELADAIDKSFKGKLEELVKLVIKPKYEAWHQTLAEYVANKKHQTHFVQFFAMLDHQDCLQLDEAARKAKSTGASLVDKMKDPIVQQFAKAMLENKFSFESESGEFCQELATSTAAKAKLGQLQDSEVFETLAKLTRNTYKQFDAAFTAENGMGFAAYVAKSHKALSEVAKIRVQALENPCSVVADLIRAAVQGLGTDELLLNQTVALFRDYLWVPQGNDAAKKTIDDETGLNKVYKWAVLRLLGLVWE